MWVFLIRREPVKPSIDRWPCFAELDLSLGLNELSANFLHKLLVSLVCIWVKHSLII
jgi:hypothetical protein